MLFIARGLTVWITAAKPIHPLPPLMGELGDINLFGLSISLLVMLVLVAILYLYRLIKPHAGWMP